MDLLSLEPKLGRGSRVGILPGSFNPPTRAHLSLAEEALAELDQIVLVLPRVFPHKAYTDAIFLHRVEMLRAAVEGHPQLSAAISEAGLFVEIAQEFRQACGGQDLTFICGRDAAERIIGWNYENSNDINKILEQFGLLVAFRGGPYVPPPHLRKFIRTIRLPSHIDPISASEVRRRIRAGEAWEHLVPDAIVPLARLIYRPVE